MILTSSPESTIRPQTMIVLGPFCAWVFIDIPYGGLDMLIPQLHRHAIEKLCWVPYTHRLDRLSIMRIVLL